jgi:thiosulfate dehydrogenase (quinone) large subunit
MLIVNPVHRLGVALLRIAVGIIFLWAGLEKVLGSGPEGFDAAGFLQFGTAGSLAWPFVGEPVEGAIYNPTQAIWSALAGNDVAMSIVNILVPWGQIGIGLSLILGLLTRFGAVMGALMMLFFFFAAWEFDHGVVNQHLTYTVVCLALAGLGAGRYYGLDAALADRVGHGVRDYLMSGDPEPERRLMAGDDPRSAMGTA